VDNAAARTKVSRQDNNSEYQGRAGEKGVSNIISEVKLLQSHLREQGFYNGKINGYYSKDVFDAVSK